MNDDLTNEERTFKHYLSSRRERIKMNNNNIGIVPPDLSLAYAALVPLVTEAHIFIKSGRIDECVKSLDKARKLIDGICECGNLAGLMFVDPSKKG